MSDYELYWKKRGSSGLRPRYRIFSDWIESGSSVLDIGCGDGRFGAYLTERKKASYLGCDISEEALALARGRGLNVMKLDASNGLRLFGERSYDYIVMSEFIEHIVNSEDVIQEAINIARKGILISIPNTAYWRFRLQLLLGSFPHQWVVQPYEHVRFWSFTDFKRTINSLGLTLCAFKSSNGRPFLRDWWPNLFGFQMCYFITR